MKRLTAISLLPLFLLFFPSGCGDGTTNPLDDIPGTLSLSVVDGNDQEAEAGEMLLNPLVVKVEEFKNDKYKPLTGYLVNFVVTEGGGSVFAGSSLTNDEGIAQEWWTLGNEGCSPDEACPNQVEVRAVDPTTGERLTFATFSATAIPVSRIAVWGYTSIIYAASAAYRSSRGYGGTDDYVLLQNILKHVSGKTSELRILNTVPCDPRESAAPFCSLTNDWSMIQPFFDAIDAIGTIDFSNLSSVDPADYDVVIANFCSPLGNPSSPLERDLLESYLSDGGAALVLGSQSCGYGGVLSYVTANTVLAEYGIQIGYPVNATWAPLSIPPSQQTGLLSGVSELQLWRVMSLHFTSGFVPVASVGGYPIVAIQGG